MFIRLNKRGQTTAEYAILIGLVVAAAIGIQALIKEGIHKRIVSEVTKLEDSEAGTGTFSVSGTTTTIRSGEEKITTEKGGKTTKETLGDGEAITRTSSETYTF